MKRRALILYGIKALYAALTLALGVLVAHLWGPAAFGSFALLWTIFVMGLILGSVGTSYYLVELLPKMSQGQYSLTLRRLTWVTTIGGLVAAILAGAVLSVLDGYWLAAVALVPGSLSAMYSGGLIAEGRQFAAGVLDGILRPMLTLLGVFVLGSSGLGPAQSVAVALFASYSVAATAGFALTLTPRSYKEELFDQPLSRMAEPLAVFVAMGILTTLLAQADRFVVAVFGSDQQLAVYAAAQNVSNTVVYAVNSISLLLLPEIAHYMAGGVSAAAMQKSLDQVCRPLVVLSFAAAFAAAMTGDRILAVFGPSFVDGQWSLVVLLMGMGASLFFGLPMSVLSMSPSRRSLVIYLSAGVALLVVLSYALLPVAGTVGVAFANATAAVSVRLGIHLHCRMAGLPTYTVLRGL